MNKTIKEYIDKEVNIIVEKNKHKHKTLKNNNYKSLDEYWRKGREHIVKQEIITPEESEDDGSKNLNFEVNKSEDEYSEY